MFVRLSSPYFCLISSNSFFITSRIFASLAKIAFNSSIVFIKSASSFSIFSRSKPVNLRNFISKIAFD